MCIRDRFASLPVDENTVGFMRATGRDEEACELFEAYFRAQELFGIPPVSYTHLDVYKRQSLLSGAMLASRNWKVRCLAVSTVAM